MARLYTKVGRKEWACSKCGKPIAIGEKHKMFTPYKQASKRYHMECEIPYSHTTNSEYKLMLNDGVEELTQLCNELSCEEDASKWEEMISTFNSTVDSLLEACIDQTHAKLDCIPEQLQETSVAQGRIDELEGIDTSEGTMGSDSDIAEYVDYMEDIIVQFENARDTR